MLVLHETLERCLGHVELKPTDSQMERICKYSNQDLMYSNEAKKNYCTTD